MDQKNSDAQEYPADNSADSSGSPGGLNISPLTKASLKLIPDVLKFLYIVYVNIPIYPAGSEMIAAPLNSLFEKLGDIFSRDRQVVFSNVKNILIVNGERLKEGEVKKTFEDNFLKFFDDLRLESMSFQKGLAKEELSQFLYILRNNSGEGQDVKSLCAKQGIKHVMLNEINYRAVTGGGAGTGAGSSHSAEDLIVLDYIVSKVLMSGQGGNALENLERNSKEVADALSKLSEDIHAKKGSEGSNQADVVLKLLQRLGNQLMDQDPNNWQKCKAGLARTLLSLQPELRDKVIFGAKNEHEKRMVENLMPELSGEDIVNIFAQAYKNKEASLEQMRFAAKSLLDQQRTDSGLKDVLQDKLMELGLDREKAEWVTVQRSFGELPLEEKATRISSVSLEDYWILRPEIEWASFIGEIIGKNRPDLFDAVINRLRQFYGSVPSEQKAEIGRDCFAFLRPGLDQPPPFAEKAWEFLIEIFLAEESSETEPLYVRALTESLQKLLEQKKFGMVANIRNILNDYPDASRIQHEKIAKIQQEIFSVGKLREVIERYIRDSGKDAEHLEFAGFISALGKPAVEILLESALADEVIVKNFGYFDAFLRRRIIGKILAELIRGGGSDALLPLLEENLKSPKEQTAQNTVELLADIRRGEVVSLLEFSLGHSDQKVRAKTVFALGKIADAKSLSLLNRAVEENIDEVRLDIISVLGRIGDSHSLAVLKKIDDSGSREAVAKAVRLIETRLNGHGRKEQ